MPKMTEMKKNLRKLEGKSPEYRVWFYMIARCHDPSCHGYENYGGKGVQVSKRWRDSFDAFLADMGPRPGPGCQIDRIASDGNYEPGNCRWLPMHENEMRQNHGAGPVPPPARSTLKSQPTLQ